MAVIPCIVPLTSIPQVFVSNFVEPWCCIVTWPEPPEPSVAAPATSKFPFASILLENDAEVASNAPLNVVAVTTPAILTLSKFVWPSTSKSLLIPTVPLELIVYLVPLLSAIENDPPAILLIV